MAEQKAKVVHGPGPRGMGGPRPKVENPGKLLKRIMAEVFQHYLPHCILVLICIVVSALANVQASLFLQTLIDDYIIPMTQQQDPSFAPLAGALVRVGCIYVVGILAAWLNARIMVNVKPSHSKFTIFICRSFIETNRCLSQKAAFCKTVLTIFSV